MQKGEKAQRYFMITANLHIYEARDYFAIFVYKINKRY